MKKILFLGLLGVLVGCDVSAKSYDVKCYSGGVEVFSASENIEYAGTYSVNRDEIKVVFSNGDKVYATGMCVIKEKK